MKTPAGTAGSLLDEVGPGPTEKPPREVRHGEEGFGANHGRRPDSAGNRPAGKQASGFRGRVRDLRDHWRPGEGDDVPLVVPTRAARGAGLPDRRGGGGGAG